MQRLVALTQGLLLGWAGLGGWGSECSLVVAWPNACWGAWGLVLGLEGCIPENRCDWESGECLGGSGSWMRCWRAKPAGRELNSACRKCESLEQCHME